MIHLRTRASGKNCRQSDGKYASHPFNLADYYLFHVYRRCPKGVDHTSDRCGTHIERRIAILDRYRYFEPLRLRSAQRNRTAAIRWEAGVRIMQNGASEEAPFMLSGLCRESVEDYYSQRTLNSRPHVSGRP